MNRAMAARAFGAAALVVMPCAGPAAQDFVFLSGNIQPSWNIYEMADDGTGLHQVTDSSEIRQWLDVSPDGTTVAYEKGVGNGQIWLMKLNPNWTVASDTELPIPVGDNLAPQWSPDGKTIAFSRRDGGNYQLYSYSLTDGAIHHLTSVPTVSEYSTWSPDSKLIAYSSTVGDDPHQSIRENIWVMNADGSAAHVLYQDPNMRCTSPAWSPDGKTIAFLSCPLGDNIFDVWLMNADGTGATEVTSGLNENAAGLSWSANGKSLLVDSLSVPTKICDIYRLDVNWSDPATSSLTRVTDGTGFCFSGSYSTMAAPEPFTMALAAAGLGLALVRRRRSK